ncbi:MAG: MmgE/PrpD family protein [Gammaproteobacteria bacterium]|nr:MmgE/PrpD family protein [Gammaproteobacteria bacterium]
MSVNPQNRSGGLPAEIPLAAQFAAFGARFSLERVPREVVQLAKRSIVDAIGVGLAASTQDFARSSVEAIAALGEPGECAVIACQPRLAPRDAALLNGLLIHGLDYDDTHPASIVHCSASAVPVMLAAGLRAGSSGAQALAAYLLAVEADARIGSIADGQFQKGGFHPTGMVGIFGATLAAGYLAGHDAGALTSAQGVALSMASGSMEFLADGAWTKRLHPGWAASSAMTAAALGASGFRAPPMAFEGRFGLYRAFLGEDRGDRLRACATDLGERWEMRNVALKPYPVCHFNHAFGDAILHLRKQGLSAGDVAHITARIHPDQVAVVCEPQAAKRRPSSDYDAKFSLPFFIAATLLRGRFTLDELADECLNDPEILALCDKISYRPDETSRFPRYYSGTLEVHTHDGRTLVAREPINRGSDARPLTDAEVAEKFMDNAARAIETPRATQILDLIMALDEAGDLEELNGLLGGQRH